MSEVRFVSSNFPSTTSAVLSLPLILIENSLYPVSRFKSIS